MAVKFLDLSKAFNTQNLDILLYKLKYDEVHVTTLALIKHTEHIINNTFNFQLVASLIIIKFMQLTFTYYIFYLFQMTVRR